jgi:hypothetical protein
MAIGLDWIDSIMKTEISLHWIDHGDWIGLDWIWIDQIMKIEIGFGSI